MLLKQKKAQMVGQMFIYILALVIMALVLIYGYSAIRSFLKTGEDINLIQTKSDIKSAIEKISSEYDSLRKETIPVPSRFKEVCFVDLNREGSLAPICDSSDATNYRPIICDSWKNKAQQNIFFSESKTKVEPFYVGNLVVNDPYYLCIDTTRNEIAFWIKGLGNSTLVSREASS